MDVRLHVNSLILQGGCFIASCLSRWGLSEDEEERFSHVSGFI